MLEQSAINQNALVVVSKNNGNVIFTYPFERFITRDQLGSLKHKKVPEEEFESTEKHFHRLITQPEIMNVSYSSNPVDI